MQRSRRLRGARRSLQGISPPPQHRHRLTARVAARPVPRVRRPSSETMNACAPHTAIHALYKSAVCPTPKLLTALVATLYPPGYRASAMTIRRMNCAAPTKKSAPRRVRFSMRIGPHPTVTGCLRILRFDFSNLFGLKAAIVEESLRETCFLNFSPRDLKIPIPGSITNALPVCTHHQRSTRKATSPQHFIYTSKTCSQYVFIVRPANANPPLDACTQSSF